MSYLEFFGLNQEPFSNIAVGKFYYNSPRHLKAITKLTYAVDTMKGLSVVEGNIGAGKTTLARRFLDTLPEDRYEAALIVMVHSSVTADWILKKIAHQLGVDDPSPDKLKLLGQLYERLAAIQEGGKKAVVLIDEAQMLRTREMMEEFRGLLNLETPEGRLISFVFFGLSEIDQNLMLDEPLAQRVAMRISLDAMDPGETEEYIKHRMGTAGNNNTPFTKEAVRIIYRYSNGIPRLINTLCDNALLEAFLVKKREIDEEMLMDVLDGLGFNRKAANPVPSSEPVKSVTSSEADEIDLLFRGLEAK